MDVAKRLANWRDQPPEQWFNAANRYLPPGITGVLVIAIAYQLATLTWTLVLHLADQGAAPAIRETPSPIAATVRGRREVFDAGLGRVVDADVIDRASAPPGAAFTGPAVVTEDQTTTYVPPGFKGSINANGHLILERRRDA